MQFLRSRKMKRQIIFNLMILLFSAAFAAASDLPVLGLLDVSQEQYANYKQGELIVCFNDISSGAQPANGPAIIGPRTRRSIRNIVSDYIVSGAIVDREYDNVKNGLAVVKLPGDTSVFDAFIRFNLSANIRYAEPNYKYNMLSSSADGIGTLISTANAIHASQATQVDTGKELNNQSKVIVAVADTGIDYNHPELAPYMWVNKAELNGEPNVDDDGNGFVDDIYGYDFAGAVAADKTDGDSDPIDTYYHGTHIAGIINNIGNKCENPVMYGKISLMALKIFADDYSLEPTVYVSDAIGAIGYAMNNGAKIINASWGGSTYSQALYDSIKDAGNAGVLVVAAAGNGYGNNNDLNPIYPASFDLDNIISVMSTDGNDHASEFSNFGPVSVDIASPGEDILSTAPTYQTSAMVSQGISSGHASLSGTSMSAAYASAQCAILMAQNPSASSQSVKNALLTTADPILASPRLNLSGGSINLQMALMAIPTGRLGKVLNTRYEPTDLTHLYDTIQAAIDDANNGDILIAQSGRLFKEAIDFKGKSITLRSGDITDPNDPNVSPVDTYILGTNNPGTSIVTFHNHEGPNTIIEGLTIGWGSGADYGGGISCEDSSPTILNCIITNNTAKYYGGGIDCYNASPTLRNCTISNNVTSDISGIAGGVNCDHSSPELINCTITYNFAANLGGAIACYYANPTVKNCLITNNSSTYLNGNIHLEYSSPNISNCTIVTDDPNVPKDGGIQAYLNSRPVITNCILWGNGDDLKNCVATYSCIEDGDFGVGNLKSDPKFLEGPLGRNYLTQIAAGQLIDSPCVNAGSPGTNPELQANDYTTSTDAIADTGVIDMGFHYPSVPAPLVQLQVLEVREDTIITPDISEYSLGHADPNGGTYRKQEVVHLTAYPDPNTKLIHWTGTDNDTTTSLQNTVTMSGNKTVTFEFAEIPQYNLRTEVIGGNGTLTPLYKRGQSFPKEQ